MEATPGRRRSQRLFLQVRIVVEVTRPNKSPFSEETHTIIVNAHGALVEMGTSLDQGQIVIMRNVRTSENIECSAGNSAPPSNSQILILASGASASLLKIGPSGIQTLKGTDPPGGFPDLRYAEPPPHTRLFA